MSRKIFSNQNYPQTHYIIHPMCLEHLSYNQLMTTYTNLLDFLYAFDNWELRKGDNYRLPNNISLLVISPRRLLILGYGPPRAWQKSISYMAFPKNYRPRSF